MNILLAVSGGIAAYKCPELVRLLIKRGARVKVIMTENAQQFVSSLTLHTLSGSAVYANSFELENGYPMGHIGLARWADHILVAPATANIIAKLNAGLADDLVSTLCLAADCPLSIVPAMNQCMWSNPATQRNVKNLLQRGINILGPAAGEQACGEQGMGRMLEPSEICELIFLKALEKQALHGKSILITAGPTRESIDPVRYISNRSSGKMGYALAHAARDFGAEVTLVSGPVNLEPPLGVKRICVESAADMYRAVMQEVESVDIFVAAAAVADYTPKAFKKEKIKKVDDELFLPLAKTVDILKAVANLPYAPFTVGFAAETTDLELYAKDKLNHKKLDMVIANWVGQARGGFEADENAVEVFWHGGRQDFEMMPKNILASHLISLITQVFIEKTTNASSPIKNS